MLLEYDHGDDSRFDEYASVMSDIDAFRAKCEEAIFTLMSHASTLQGSRTGTSSSSNSVSNVSGTENFQNDSAIWAGQPWPEANSTPALIETLLAPPTADDRDALVRELEGFKAEMAKSRMRIGMLCSFGVPTVTENPPFSEAPHNASVDMRAALAATTSALSFILQNGYTKAHPELKLMSFKTADEKNPIGDIVYRRESEFEASGQEMSVAAIENEGMTTTTLLDTQPSTPVCVGSKLDAVVEDDAENYMCDFNAQDVARLACLRAASCLGCKFCQWPEEQDPCNVYDVNVRMSDIFACDLEHRIRNRCAANMIQLANNDDFMIALHIQTSELELDLYESQEQVNRLVYATYNQIWQSNETRKIDTINLQNNELQVDRIIFDFDCNTPNPLPQCQNSTKIQRMPTPKDSEIGGSWGIRLLTRTSTPFSKQTKTQTKEAVHLGDHPVVCVAVNGKRVMKRMFGTARVMWATIMLALFDAAGVLVNAPQPPKVFRPGRAVRHVIFFALMVMALLHSLTLIIEQSVFMVITAIGSAATWVTPLRLHTRPSAFIPLV